MVRLLLITDSRLIAKILKILNYGTSYNGQAIFISFFISWPPFSYNLDIFNLFLCLIRSFSLFLFDSIFWPLFVWFDLLTSFCLIRSFDLFLFDSIFWPLFVWFDLLTYLEHFRMFSGPMFVLCTRLKYEWIPPELSAPLDCHVHNFFISTFQKDHPQISTFHMLKQLDRGRGE